MDDTDTTWYGQRQTHRREESDKEFRRYMFQMATLAAVSVMLTVGGFMAIVIVMVPK